MVDLTDLFHSMLEEGIVPNHNVFSILINTYAKGGMLAQAMNILKEMTHQVMKPNMVSYSSHWWIWRKGRMDDAI
jgi:pentatricopeptide repeat protein